MFVYFFNPVYKTNLISTIVDMPGVMVRGVTVYKTNLISTIVDKVLLISLVVCL